MTITLTHDRRVKLATSIDLPMSRRRLWSEIADLPRFATHDFFHARFDLPDGRLESGAPLRILHRYGPLKVRRVGRILRYVPQRGYAFSDLSSRSMLAGFPHVFSYEIESLEPYCSRLHLTVTGRWTMRFLPRPFARLWLWWVFIQIVSKIEIELLLCCPTHWKPPCPNDAKDRCTRAAHGYTA